jgi:hypothetical protein
MPFPDHPDGHEYDCTVAQLENAQQALWLTKAHTLIVHA